MDTILIIEDNIMEARLYERIFSHAGFETHLTTNGSDGLQIAKTLLPKIIFLDILLPGMGGLTVLAQLKTNDATRKIPVIVLSNMEKQEDIREAYNRGASQYVVKSSCEPDALLKIANDILGKTLGLTDTPKPA